MHLMVIIRAHRCHALFHYGLHDWVSLVCFRIIYGSAILAFGICPVFVEVMAVNMDTFKAVMLISST